MTTHSAYVDSGIEWIGGIPKGWQVKPFFVAFDALRRKNSDLSEQNLLSLSYGRIIRKDIAAADGLLPESFDTYQVIERDDIVFRFTDLQNDKRSLRSAIASERGIITSAYLGVRAKSGSPYYLSYLMRAYDAQKVFYSMGGGLRQSMKFDDVKRLPVLFPPLEEQRQIAAYLDRETGKIDTLIAKQEQLVTTLSERRKALIARAVSRGEDDNVSMIPSGDRFIGEIPAHWQVKKLSLLFETIGSGTTPPDDGAGYYGSGVPWVTTGELRESVIFTTAKTVTLHAVSALSALKVFPAGSLVIAMYGATIGRLGVLGVDATTNQACCVMAHPIGVETTFVYLALQAATERLLVLATGGGQPNINQDIVRQLRIAVPPLDEQRQIVWAVNTAAGRLEALTAKATAAVVLLRERRQALISAAVTGKIDVRGL